MPESATGTVVTNETITTTQTETDIRNTISKSDPYLVDRIVGYHEYGRALHYLDRLVSQCDKYEMDAIEEIVRSEPEFAIYTVSGVRQPGREHLAGDLKSAGTSKIAPTSGSEDGRKRHGLRWVTALARVEVGAMQAGFSQTPRPFSHAASPGFDAAEYKTLLTESARLHFWTLDRDPMFVSLSKRFQPTSWTLAYLRRLNIATAFALAATQVSLPKEVQRLAEMSGYTKRLHAARTAIQLKIAAYLAQVEIARRLETDTSSRLSLAELCNEGVCRQFATSK